MADNRIGREFMLNLNDERWHAACTRADKTVVWVRLCPTRKLHEQCVDIVYSRNVPAVSLPCISTEHITLQYTWNMIPWVGETKALGKKPGWMSFRI